MDEIKKYKTKIDLLLILIIIISLILICYSIFYIFSYYQINNILTEVPKNIKNDKLPLEPNEIGDSIGGTLNPIIALTASVLTFLAFYIQYKANKSQREIFNLSIENEVVKLSNEKKLKEQEQFNVYETNLKIFKTLINSMVEYFEENADYLKKFIIKEDEKPLRSNIYNFTTDSSYKYFNQLEFKEIYNSIVHYFNERYPNSEWEKDFIEILNIIDFYDKMIIRLQETYITHSKSKFQNLTNIGLKLDEKMEAILRDNYLSNHHSLVKYFEIVHNKDTEGKDVVLKEVFMKEGVDFEKLQKEFFNKFIPHLKLLSDNLRDKNSIELLEEFSKMNKSIGTEIFQTNHYVQDLKIRYSNYFDTNNESYPLKKVRLFIEKINFT